MNREGRVRGETGWYECGPLTHVETAEVVARIYFAKGSMKMPVNLIIDTRDEADGSAGVHHVTLDLCVKVKPMRGDD